MSDFKLFQPADLYKVLDVKNTAEADKIMANVLNILVYLDVGDKFVTSAVTFEKISNDLLQISVDMDKRVMLDELEKKRVIKLPI